MLSLISNRMTIVLKYFSRSSKLSAYFGNYKLGKLIFIIMTKTTNLSPRDLLSRLTDSKSSGCLELYEGLVSWKIYLQQGNIKYVYCSAQLLDQLKYYLHYFGCKQAVAALKELPLYCVKIQLQSPSQQQSSESNLYSEVISWLLAKKHLTSFQGLQLLEHITKDVLQSCLWLDSGTSLWCDGEPIPLWIQEQFGNSRSLSLSECLHLEQNRLKKWQKCSTQLLSVHQRPYFASGWEQKPLPASGSLNHQNLKELAQVIQGRTSIRQLSILLQKDELHVAQILSPYIDDKIIYLRDAQPPLDKLPSISRSKKSVQPLLKVTPYTESKKTEVTNFRASVKTWKIVCIDDSPTILKEMQRFLSPDKFEVTAIEDSVQAVSIIFRVKPDLILLDITMPKVNGYKLCTLLRGSEYCNQTPIIMVTGNNGVLDKARATIAGATDYFTKPFTREGLVKIVEKYLN